MNLELTDEQELLRDSLRRLLADQSSPAVVRSVETGTEGYCPKLWESLAGLGVLGLGVGGDAEAGLGAIEMAVAYEEFGRALAPTPHLETVVIGGGLIARAGSPDQKAAWLERIVQGQAIIAPAFFEPGNSQGPNGIQLRAQRDGDGYRLNGRKFFVHCASAATRLLVMARTGEGLEDVSLFLVDPQRPGVSLTRTATQALDAKFAVDFADVRVSDADRLGDADTGWSHWSAVAPLVQIAQSAWFSGCGERALELATDYSKTREQFDRPLGSFQAVAHQLADSATALTSGRLLARQAAWAKDRGRPYGRLAAIAHLHTAEAARFATRTAHQIFGGIGFTNALDVQLYSRRAKQHAVSWFGVRDLEDVVARAVIDGEE